MLFALYSADGIIILLYLIEKGDYYETGTWLTEDEKHEMDEKEKSRRDRGMRRPQLKMALSIDVAERKTIFNDCEDMEDKVVSQPDIASNFSQLKIDYELGNSVTGEFIE